MAEDKTDTNEQDATAPAEGDTAQQSPATETPPEAAGEAPVADQAPAEAEAPVAEAPRSVPAPPLPEGVHYIWGTGRRKKAIARVRIRPGTGQILINKRDKDAYFVHDADRAAVVAPLVAVDMNASWDIWANVSGGGSTGQADAVKLGLARALSRAAPDTEHALRDKGLLTRDPRMPERKKPGQPGARKRFQFSKR